MEMEHLRTELQSTVQSAIQELSSAVESVAAKQELHSAFRLSQEVGEARCPSQMVLPNQLNAEFASKDQFMQLQDNLQAVSSHLQGDLDSVSKRISGMATSVQNAVAGYSLCLSQHTETLQKHTSLSDQCQVFNARLTTVEQSAHSAFLEQLKRDADIIPESIRERDDLPSSPKEAEPVQVWPRLSSRQSSADPCAHLTSRAPAQVMTPRKPRSGTPRCPPPEDSFLSPGRGKGAMRSQSLSIPSEKPHGVPGLTLGGFLQENGCHDLLRGRVSARSWSPRLDRLDAGLPLTIVESPQRVHRTPSIAKEKAQSSEVRPKSPDAQSFHSEVLVSSRSSSIDKKECNSTNSCRASRFSSWTQSAPSATQDTQVESAPTAPDNTIAPASNVNAQGSHSSLASSALLRGRGAEDEASDTQRLPSPTTNTAPRINPGGMSPLPSRPERPRIILTCTTSEAEAPPACSRSLSSAAASMTQGSTSDIAASPPAPGSRSPATFATASAAFASGLTSVRPPMKASLKESAVVTGRGACAKVFRSPSTDGPQQGCALSSAGSRALSGGQRSVGYPGQAPSPGQVRMSRMMGLACT